MSLKKEISFKNYLAIQTTGGARWHPKEKRIVFINDAPGNFQIYTADIEENKISDSTLLTEAENRSTDPRYLSDGSILFLRDDGGNENFQLNLINKKGKEIQITTDLKAKHIVNTTSEDYLYFRANIEDKSRFDVYRQKIPLEENSSEKIFEPEEGIPNSGFTSDDERYVFQLAHGNMHREIILLDINKKESLNLTRSLSQNQEYRWSPIRWLDDDHLLIASDYESDFFMLGILSLEEKYNPLDEIKIKYDLSSVAWNNTSPYTFLVYNEEGYSSLYKSIITSTGVKQLKKMQLPIGGVIASGDARSTTQSMHLSDDGNFLALHITSPTNATNVWIIDIERNICWQATESDLAGIDKKTFVDASLHRFESFDGLSVPYFKYLPQGEKPKNGWPTIFIIHGGPEAQLLPSFNPVAQFLLSAGYAIIGPNIRGSNGYGRKYLDLDNKEKRLDSILDIKHLAIHLQEDPDIDKEKLIIYGGSYGGFAVLSAMTEHPELWAAGIDIVGISSFVTFLKNTAPWRRKLREAEYGSLEEDLEMLESISPIHKIDNISAPLFIIQGDNDERVPLTESIQIYEKLKEKGLRVELLRFANEGHGITRLENKITAYSRVIEWLKEVLE
jgi:dipeptidyl aminopeptidase/acylaminoacyl peptidase